MDWSKLKMTIDILQLKVRILYLEKELEKWKNDYLLLKEKLRQNPSTRDTFAIKDPRELKDGKYVDY